MKRPLIHKSEALTQRQARTQFIMMLGSARSLDELSVEQLARSYRLPVKEIAQRLAEARSKRERLL